jgi:hypothetical protein
MYDMDMICVCDNHLNAFLLQYPVDKVQPCSVVNTTQEAPEAGRGSKEPTADFDSSSDRGPHSIFTQSSFHRFADSFAPILQSLTRLRGTWLDASCSLLLLHFVSNGICFGGEIFVLAALCFTWRDGHKIISFESFWKLKIEVREHPILNFGANCKYLDDQRMSYQIYLAAMNTQRTFVTRFFGIQST